MMEQSTKAADVWSDGLAQLRKLRTLPAKELMFRARYRMLTAWERSRHQPDRAIDLQRVDLRMSGMPRQHASWREWLLARRRERHASFLPGLDNKEQMRELFRTRYAREFEVSKRKAEDTRSHIFEFFGQRFHYESQIDWHADPVSRQRWPLVYHRDVPIHDAASRFGDVKYVWELNRQQFLLDLGKVCFLEDSGTHAADAVGLVKSWILQNPRGLGVNWSCALEPAFRSLSWLWTYHLCLDSNGLDDDSHLVWLAGLHDHGRFLDQHLERYSSPYNHLIGEAAALYALGVLFPEFRRARLWRRHGRHVLESRLAEQFYRDGGSVEQSTFYHHATLGFYIFAALIGRANGEEFSDRIWQTIERAIEFSMYLTQPDGSTPAIGGADDGKPIRMQHGSLWDFRAFQALGAVLFDRQDMKYVAGDFPEDALWLLGPGGRERFDALSSVPPGDTSHALTASGYFVARNTWDRDGDYLCFDCGEQADSVRRDSVPNAVHGHADCLSAIVWLGGHPVLVDPGMYRYDGDPQWVGHFRRTGAHNTLNVDGRDQAQYHGKMSWSTAFQANLEAWHPGATQASVMGRHDGYLRGSDGVIHRRVAWMRPDGYVILWDEIVGEGEHDLELRYQFAPGSTETINGNSLLFGAFAEMAWAASVNASAELRCGGDSPGDGWVATGLGVRLPAPVLTLRARFRAPRVMFVAVLADRRVTAGAARLTVVRQHARGIAVSVRVGTWLTGS